MMETPSEYKARWAREERANNPAKVHARYNAYYKKHKPKFAIQRWMNNLKCRYGLTLDEYGSLYEDQDWACAICKQPETGRTGSINLHVDHDHKTGEVRGLLCGHCNRGIAGLRENVETILAAAAYLS